MSALLANGITKTSELRKAYQALEIPQSENTPSSLLGALITQISEDNSRNQYRLTRSNGQMSAIFSDQGRLAALDINYKVPVSLRSRVKNAAAAAICLCVMAVQLSLNQPSPISAWAVGLAGAAGAAVGAVAGWFSLKSRSEFHLEQDANGSISYQKKFGGEQSSKGPVFGRIDTIQG